MTLIPEGTLDKLTSPNAARQGLLRLPAQARKLIVSAVVTAALLVALPGAVAAQATSPTSAQYHDQVRLAQEQIHQAGTASSDPRVIDALPFTGVDLVLLGIVALSLGGAGIAIYRLSRTAESNERT
jgi:hypothetical protein